MDFIPTYDKYRQILSSIITAGSLCDYPEAEHRSAFIILRHDIEFSIERAMTMSLIETEMGVRSTYFVQIRSNAYNAFSLNNTAMLLDMHRRGHRIGLHYHIGASMDPQTVAGEIAAQCQLLSDMLQIPIDRYSMHRPQKETAYYRTEIQGLFNAYGPSFFTFCEEPEANGPLHVKYISDAKHRWNYGTPDPAAFKTCPRIQLLIHPDFWSEDSPEMRDNFAGLIREHALTFTDTIDNECHHFSEFREAFEARFSD